MLLMLLFILYSNKTRNGRNENIDENKKKNIKKRKKKTI